MQPAMITLYLPHPTCKTSQIKRLEYMLDLCVMHEPKPLNHLYNLIKQQLDELVK